MEKLKHVKGPYRIFGENSFDIYAAPHSCADPECPGDINRRKLEAVEEMARAIRDILNEEVHLDGVKAALSVWEKTGKGGG